MKLRSKQKSLLKEFTPILLLLIPLSFYISPLLELPLWFDDQTYVPSNIADFSFLHFLGWDYSPQPFMGHPRLLPFLYSSVYKLTGTLFYLKITNIIFSYLFLTSLYFLYHLSFSKRLSIFLTSLTALSPIFLGHMSGPTGDIPCATFMFLTYFFWVKKKLNWCALFLALAVLTRESALAMAVALFVDSLLSKRLRQEKIVFIPFAIIFINFIATNFRLVKKVSTHFNLSNPIEIVFSLNPVHLWSSLVKFWISSIFEFGPLILGFLTILLLSWLLLLLIKKEKFLAQNQYRPLVLFFIIHVSFFIWYNDHNSRDFIATNPLAILFLFLFPTKVMTTLPKNWIVLSLFTLLFLRQIDANFHPQTFQVVSSYKNYIREVSLAKKLLAQIEKIVGHSNKISLSYPYEAYSKSSFYGYVKKGLNVTYEAKSAKYILFDSENNYFWPLNLNKENWLDISKALEQPLDQPQRYKLLRAK